MPLHVSTSPLSCTAVAALTAFALLALCAERRARADAGDPSASSTQGEPRSIDAPAAGEASAQARWRPTFFVDARSGMLVRSNTDYFGQAETFGYPISSVAPGLGLQVGYELLPRFSLAAVGSFYREDSTRRFAKLAIASESLLLHARYAALRWSSDPVMAEVVATLGGGRYWLKEGYSDPSLFAGTITHDASGLGFATGVELALHVAGFRTTVGYAYHWAPVGVSNNLGGEVRAGGHELTFGFGARF